MLSAAVSPFPTAPASPAARPNYLHQLLLCFLVLLFSLKLINKRVDETHISCMDFFVVVGGDSFHFAEFSVSF